jgi:hypothetical protein
LSIVRIAVESGDKFIDDSLIIGFISVKKNPDSSLFFTISFFVGLNTWVELLCQLEGEIYRLFEFIRIGLLGLAL